MQIVGITGSIGCGKTYLANLLKSMGYSVYNPDLWVRDLYRKKDFIEVIKQNFPLAFNKDGCLDKRALRDIVFNDNKQLKKLESLIHPFLKCRLKKVIHQFAKEEDLLFLDAALLIEAGWDRYCDYVILADVDEKIQIERVMKRDNVKEEDVKKIIAVQSDKMQKYSVAHYVIDTGLANGVNKIQLIKFIQEIS